MKRCVLALLALALCNLLYVGMAQAAPAGQENVRVAVLPFQISGGADVDSLNDELPALFAQRLAARGFKVVPPKDTLRLLRQQKVSQLNLAAARSVARQTGADYAVYGSFNKTGDAFSIDAAWWTPPAKRARSPISRRRRTSLSCSPPWTSWSNT